MRNRVSATVGFLIATLVGTMVSMPAIALTPPPIEAYGKLPNIQSVILSPGGTHYAAVQILNGAKCLVIYDMYGTPGKNAKAMDFSGSRKLDEELKRIFWVNDTRLVAVVEIPSKRWGTAVIETRMIAMNADMTEVQIIPKPKARSKSKSAVYNSSVAQIQDRVLHILPNDPNNILIEFDREGYGQELHVYSLDVYTGQLKRLMSGGNPGVSGYEVDGSGAVRIRYRYIRSKEEFITELKRPGRPGWDKILDAQTDGLGEYSVLAFSSDPERLFVTKRKKKGRREIHELDIPSMTITRKVFSHDKVDVGSADLDEDGHRVVGFSWTEHRDRTKYIDNTWKSAIEAVDQLLPGQVNTLVSRDSIGQKWTVHSASGDEPGAWYLFNKDQNRLYNIGRSYPLLKGVALAAVEPFEFEARDGLLIPGYITRPQGSGPYPTVVLPHGGPNSRDSMGFDYEVQFLASRGYAVFQPNFRGSSGFGEAFEKAGHHQWGLAMQDDLTDGTRALIARSIADPNRICIVGGSYGGYAALMGVVKTPDLYQCASSFGGVTDVKKLLAYWDEFKFSNGNDPRIGDKWDDRGRIRDTSPANNIDAITAPVLLMHGENDRRVPVDQSKRMARKLKKAKKPYKLVIFEGGDHHLSFEQNRIQYLRELETFLDQHIGD